MRISDDLTALVFELQRASSPKGKARAMARAWRTIRKLNPTERRLLAREVGFDGAEELVEGLAGKSGGAFAPAAVLEALGRIRKDQDLSFRGILSDLKDPDRREELLARGIDLIAGDQPDEPSAEMDTTLEDGQASGEGPAERSASVFEADLPSHEDADRAGERPVVDPEDEPEPVDLVPPPPPIGEKPTHEPNLESAPKPVLEPELVPDPVVDDEDGRSWSEMWRQAPAAMAVPMVVGSKTRTWSSDDAKRPREAKGPVLHRLRAFRDGIGAFRGGGGSAAASEALKQFPEPWAKRRALVALIESGIPEETAATLDLIDELDRPMDRRWCLSALARRGGLDGHDLERALAMLASPAARRRVRALAAAAN